MTVCARAAQAGGLRPQQPQVGLRDRVHALLPARCRRAADRQRALKRARVDCANLFSTQSAIEANGFRSLEDPGASPRCKPSSR